MSGDSLRENITAEEGTWYGGQLHLQGRREISPEPMDLLGTLRLEVANGPGGWYQRAGASAGVALGFGGTEATGEVGAGRAWGRVPLQRRFFLGGPSAVGGVTSGQLVGLGYWFTRVAAARGRVRLGAGLFGDLGGDGGWSEVSPRQPIANVGAAVSVLDGNLRLSVEHFFRGGS